MRTRLTAQDRDEVRQEEQEAGRKTGKAGAARCGQRGAAAKCRCPDVTTGTARRCVRGCGARCPQEVRPCAPGQSSNHREPLRGGAGGSRAASVRPQAVLITGVSRHVVAVTRPACSHEHAGSLRIHWSPEAALPARRGRCRDRPRGQIISSRVRARPADRALSSDQAACSPLGCAGLGPSGRRSLAQITTAVRLASFLRE